MVLRELHTGINRFASNVLPKFHQNLQDYRALRWMWIIEDYAENQHDNEKWLLWIGQFPKLYRLARWLDDYV